MSAHDQCEQLARRLQLSLSAKQAKIDSLTEENATLIEEARESAAQRRQLQGEIEILSNRVLELRAELGKQEAHGVFIKPASLAIEDAVAALPDARPGDVIQEPGTGREWVKVTDRDTWLERETKPAR